MAIVILYLEFGILNVYQDFKWHIVILSEETQIHKQERNTYYTSSNNEAFNNIW